MRRNSSIVPSAERVNGLRVFGHNDSVDDGDGKIFLWPLKQVRTFATVAERLYVSSTHASDALLLAIDIINSEGMGEVVTATTDGKNFVDTGHDVLFVNSATVIEPGGVALGNIYLTRDNTDVGEDGIPDDITKIEAFIPLNHGTTQQAAYRLPLDFAEGADYLGGIVNVGGTTPIAGIEVEFHYLPYGAAILTYETWILGENSGVNTLGIPFTSVGLAGSILWVTVKTNGTNSVKVSGVFYLTLKR